MNLIPFGMGLKFYLLNYYKKMLSCPAARHTHLQSKIGHKIDICSLFNKNWIFSLNMSSF